MHRIPSALARALLSLTLAVAGGAVLAQTPEQTKKMLDDQEYCYGLAAMAHMTVLQRNDGRTLDEQLERRRKSLGADSTEFKLVEDVARQVYDKDLRNSLIVAADTHGSCLQAKRLTPSFNERAVRSCPAVGLLVAEVSEARRRGASVEQVVTLVGDRYGTLGKRYKGGVEKLAANYTEASPADAGNTDYIMCMVLGMTGVVRP